MTEPLNTGPDADPELVERVEPVMAALRRFVDDAAAPDDAALLDEASARRLGGGRNNSLFACAIASQDVCVKLHQPTRQRAQREWEALVLLAGQGLRIAPAPICYQPSERRPAMAMSLVPGHAIGPAGLSPTLVEAVAEANRQLHAIERPPQESDGLPVRLTDTGMLRKARRFFDLHADHATPLRKQLLAAWSGWSTGEDPDLLAAPITEVLGQGDPNLTNYLWDGSQVSLIDFEYGGWSNRPYELALLIEHVQSRDTPDHLWLSLLDQSGLSTDEHRRLPAARRLVSWFWTMTFWPDHDVDDEKFTTQAERVMHVQSSGAG